MDVIADVERGPGLTDEMLNELRERLAALPPARFERAMRVSWGSTFARIYAT
jgi:hypothetical protein